MEISPASRAEEKNSQIQTRNLILKWAITIFSGLAVYLAPVPEGVTPESWRLLAIFIATIVGSILRPAPGGAMVLLGIAAIALTKSMPLSEAMIGTVTDPARPDSKAVETLRIKSTLAGYADPVVWLVLAAFFMSRAMIKTGLGRRIALLFIRAIGHRSLGLGYALVGTDFLLASVIPSNAARSGGIIFPIARSVAETYDSKPGPTARRLGSFLMSFMYQCEVIISATFLTGQTGNLLIQRFARQQSGIDLNYQTWLLSAIAPSLVCLMITPPLLYRLFPPEVTHTPDAAKFARTELEKMGRMTWREKVMLLVFAFVAFMWATTNGLHTIDYSVVAMAGI
ncbi:MAG TPA: DASS family sodium-coupled anion symporter, partial [Blastocatellia bacterium]|nr:DASS family sodium-coupled anion symporter [Blastocatellia bacterium]